MDNQIQQNQESHKGKGALDAFLNLLSIISLGWLAFAFGGTLFQIINKFFTNPAFEYSSQFSGTALKFNLASIIIVTPVLLIAFGMLHKNYKENKLNHQSGIYRWLTYLMLLAAIGNIIGSLIALVFKLLNGEYFAGPLLKIGVVFFIALAIFGFYFYDLRRKDYSKRTQITQTSFIAIIAVAVILVVTGIIVSGSPQTARQLAFDQRRVNDLSTLRYQVEEYYRTNTKLPDDLSADQFVRFLDPETKQPYDYKKNGDKDFELCATFSTDATKAPNIDGYVGAEAWYYHKTGQQCFKLKIQVPDANAVPLKSGPVVF